MVPGSTKTKSGKILMKPAKSAPARAWFSSRAAEHALHDRLIGAPIPDADHGIAEDE